MSKLKKRVVYAGDVLNGLMLKEWTPTEAAELLQGLPEANPDAFVPVIRCRECVHAKKCKGKQSRISHLSGIPYGNS